MLDRILMAELRSFILFVSVIVVALAGAGCGAGGGRLSGPAGATPAATPTAAPAGTTEQATGTPIAAPASFAIGPASIESNRDRLESYRARIVLEFEGSRAGQRSAGRIELRSGINRRQEARYDYLNVEAVIPNIEHPPGVSEFYQVADQVYITRTGQSSWFRDAGRQLSPQDMDFLELERWVILPADTAAPPEAKTWNGLAAQRYRFTEADLSHPQIVFEAAQGEVWVAEAGDYVTQYVISASLSSRQPVPGTSIMDEGTLSLRYTLTDVNGDVAIRLPDDITGTQESLLATVPYLPDAELVSVFPALIEYTSAISAISATLFYRDELAALDWEEQGSTIFVEKADLSFAKDGYRLMIIITPTGDKRIKVVLNLEAMP